MKFTSNKSLLSEAVNNILPAVASKSSLIALEGIKLECVSNILFLTGYNLELGIKKTIEVSGTQNGSVVLTASLLSNIINKMPEGNVSFETDEKLLTVIRCNEVEFTILGLSCDDYPDMPVISKDSEFSIEHGKLRKMISQTLFCVSQSDQNVIHTGSLFDISDKMMNIVSVDGFRLAMKSTPVDIDESFKFVVPGKTLSEVVKLLSRIDPDESEDNININITHKHISFSINGYEFISRLLDGDFLDYKAAIPKESKTIVVIETRDFLDTMNRASIIINERTKSPIKCVFKENSVKVFCETSLGKINDEVDCSIDGPEVMIGFNNKYMADALKASECEKIRIELNGAISPMKLVPADGDGFLFLVLPVRLK